VPRSVVRVAVSWMVLVAPIRVPVVGVPVRAVPSQKSPSGRPSAFTVVTVKPAGAERMDRPATPARNVNTPWPSASGARKAGLVKEKLTRV